MAEAKTTRKDDTLRVSRVDIASSALKAEYKLPFTGQAYCELARTLSCTGRFCDLK